MNKRVLLIDLDPQESLTYWLGIEKPKKTVYDFFDGTASLSACTVRHSSGLDVITSDEMLATVTPSVTQLKYGLMGHNYDFVLLDCSPTLGMLTLAALTAADWVIIPFCPDLLSIKGMSQLLGTIHTVQEETNAKLVLKAVIATRYNQRKRLHQEVLEQIREFYKNVTIFTVRENIAISESPVEGKSVLDYKPKSTGAIDYYEIARELINGR